MNDKTQTVIVLRGKVLPDMVKQMLAQYGTVRFLEESLIEVIQAPPPVRSDEKYKRHVHGNFGAKMFRQMIVEGYTLFNNSQRGTLIRIYGSIVYLLDIKKISMETTFASMPLNTFLAEYDRSYQRLMAPRILSVLQSNTAQFFDGPRQVTLDEGFALIGWDGSSPNKGKVPGDQEPPLFTNRKGSFSYKMFLQLLDQGFTAFNDRNRTYVVIDGKRTLIFRSDQSNGGYSVVETKTFLQEFKTNAWGGTFIQRVRSTINKIKTFIVPTSVLSNEEWDTMFLDLIQNAKAQKS